ncbi:hypothetical protein [Methanogenium organophilum]|uniref:Uncharacterized protein n=1 Tax=Methanogenium organophilum TaxID=2199 RepID=A0A9X9S670_METOG|nr:hypothetical protein [Methanogenium organophilum]WAI02160.1 hypothetical protein OU421_04625 [Methanogenium organophilum]
MINSASPAFILIFLVFQPGVTTAIIGAICYAALSRIPTAGWVKTGICLACAFAGAVLFAAMGNVSGTGPLYLFAVLFFIFSGPLICLSPLFILAERNDFAPYAGYPAIMAALFCAAATTGLIQILNINAFIAAGASVLAPGMLYLISFTIMAGIQVVLSAEFFMIAVAVQRRRQEIREETPTE